MLQGKDLTLLQIALISLATVGVLDAIPQPANVTYLTKLSRLMPAGGTLDPAVISQVQTHPRLDPVSVIEGR